MITNVHAYLLVLGDHFSPSSVEISTSLRFSQKNEVGDLGATGKFREKPLPFGSGQLEIDPADSSSPNLLDPNSEILRMPNLVPILREHGATEIVLYIDLGYVDQCNFELHPELVRQLAELQVAVAISCYEDPGDL